MKHPKKLMQTERFSIHGRKIETKPITYQLDYSAYLKSKYKQNQNGHSSQSQ